MNALIDGTPVPIDTALALTKERMSSLGITQPRVRIGDHYTPPRPEYKQSTDMALIQSAFIGGPRVRFI